MESCEPQTLMSVVWASSVCARLPPPPDEVAAWVARLPFKLLPRLVHQPRQHPGSSHQSEGELIAALSDEIGFEHDRIVSATGQFGSCVYRFLVYLALSSTSRCRLPLAPLPCPCSRALSLLSS